MSFGGKVDKTSNVELSGEGWPNLSTDEFRQLRRIPHTFDNSSIAAAITIAAFNVQGQLESLQINEASPPLNIAKSTLYKRAVYGRAHAELLPEFATQDRRKEGESVATDDPQQSARFMAQSNRDVRALLGCSGNGVDFI